MSISGEIQPIPESFNDDTNISTKMSTDIDLSADKDALLYQEVTKVALIANQMNVKSSAVPQRSPSKVAPNSKDMPPARTTNALESRAPFSLSKGNDSNKPRTTGVSRRATTYGAAQSNSSTNIDSKRSSDTKNPVSAPKRANARSVETILSTAGLSTELTFDEPSAPAAHSSIAIPIESKRRQNDNTNVGNNLNTKKISDQTSSKSLSGNTSETVSRRQVWGLLRGRATTQRLANYQPPAHLQASEFYKASPERQTNPLHTKKVQAIREQVNKTLEHKQRQLKIQPQRNKSATNTTINEKSANHDSYQGENKLPSYMRPIHHAGPNPHSPQNIINQNLLSDEDAQMLMPSKELENHNEEGLLNASALDVHEHIRTKPLFGSHQPKKERSKSAPVYTQRIMTSSSVVSNSAMKSPGPIFSALKPQVKESHEPVVIKSSLSVHTIFRRNQNTVSDGTLPLPAAQSSLQKQKETSINSSISQMITTLQSKSPLQEAKPVDKTSYHGKKVALNELKTTGETRSRSAENRGREPTPRAHKDSHFTAKGNVNQAHRAPSAALLAIRKGSFSRSRSNSPSVHNSPISSPIIGGKKSFNQDITESQLLRAADLSISAKGPPSLPVSPDPTLSATMNMAATASVLYTHTHTLIDGIWVPVETSQVGNAAISTNIDTMNSPLSKTPIQLPALILPAVSDESLSADKLQLNETSHVYRSPVILESSVSLQMSAKSDAVQMTETSPGMHEMHKRLRQYVATKIPTPGKPSGTFVNRTSPPSRTPSPGRTISNSISPATDAATVSGAAAIGHGFSHIKPRQLDLTRYNSDIKKCLYASELHSARMYVEEERSKINMQTATLSSAEKQSNTYAAPTVPTTSSPATVRLRESGLPILASREKNSTFSPSQNVISKLSPKKSPIIATTDPQRKLFIASNISQVKNANDFSATTAATVSMAADIISLGLIEPAERDDDTSANHSLGIHTADKMSVAENSQFDMPNSEKLEMQLEHDTYAEKEHLLDDDDSSVLNVRPLGQSLTDAARQTSQAQTFPAKEAELITSQVSNTISATIEAAVDSFLAGDEHDDLFDIANEGGSEHDKTESDADTILSSRSHSRPETPLQMLSDVLLDPNVVENEEILPLQKDNKSIQNDK